MKLMSRGELCLSESSTMEEICLLFSLFLIVNSSMTVEKIRVKRGTGPQTIPLTDHQKEEILLIHNDLRVLSGATNMRYMTWDSELAWLAEKYGKLCQYKHNPDRKHSNISSVGENIYATTADVSTFVASKAVKMWYDEIVYFDHNTRTCRPGKMCGHYTQIVWATSYKIGCSLTVCGFLSEINWKHAVIFICNYAPAGNIVSGRDRRLLPLFEKGEGCSKCDKGDYCRNGGLCANSARDFIEEPPTPDKASGGSAGYIVPIVLLVVVVCALVIFTIYRDRIKLSVRLGFWRKRDDTAPTRFSNQNTPTTSRFNTPRHSLVSNNLHGMQRITAADIIHPISKLKSEERFQSVSAPVTPRKGYSKGMQTPPRPPPPKMPPPPPISKPRV